MTLNLEQPIIWKDQIFNSEFLLTRRFDPNIKHLDLIFFQVEFDVQDYRPEELSIKTEGDVLVVLAKHETKDGESPSSSFVSKQFEQVRNI